MRNGQRGINGVENRLIGSVLCALQFNRIWYGALRVPAQTTQALGDFCLKRLRIGHPAAAQPLSARAKGSDGSNTVQTGHVLNDLQLVVILSSDRQTSWYDIL